MQIGLLYNKLERPMRWECGAVLTASSPSRSMLALWGNARPRGKGNMDNLLGPFVAVCMNRQEELGAMSRYQQTGEHVCACSQQQERLG